MLWKNISIALAGGIAAVLFVAGMVWLGEHSPDWLGPLIVLLAVFAFGACCALAFADEG